MIRVRWFVGGNGEFPLYCPTTCLVIFQIACPVMWLFCISFQVMSIGGISLPECVSVHLFLFFLFDPYLVILSTASLMPGERVVCIGCVKWFPEGVVVDWGRQPTSAFATDANRLIVILRSYGHCLLLFVCVLWLWSCVWNSLKIIFKRRISSLGVYSDNVFSLLCDQLPAFSHVLGFNWGLTVVNSVFVYSIYFMARRWMFELWSCKPSCFT